VRFFCVLGSRQRRTDKIIPRLDGVYREVPGIQGVADFVGIQFKDWTKQSRKLNNAFKSHPRSPVAEILAHLTRPQNKEALLKRTGYSKSVFLSALARLTKARIIILDARGNYRLASKYRIRAFELYFFELKLTKWQRALAQAVQAKLYANKVFCVFPVTAKRIIEKRRAAFEDLKVGVLFFDPMSMTIQECIRAPLAHSTRVSFKIDVLLKLAELEARSKRFKSSDGIWSNLCALTKRVFGLIVFWRA
jgi:DNA-binding transcriptional ArsR family regulator